MAAHCGVHCTVHCACTVRALCKTRSLCNSASGGVEEHSLFVGSSCEDESVFGLDFGTCTSLRLQSHQPKKINLVLLCLLGRSFEDESVFGLRFWQMQKGVCSSLCLHIHKPKNLSRTESGFFKKKQPSCQTQCEETCMPPFPQFNVATSLCLERSSKKQPFRFGCRHALGNNIDQGGGGDQV